MNRPAFRSVPTLVAIGGLACSAGVALADAQKRKADASLTSSVLNGGDRELSVLRFAGSTTVMTGADFLRWGGGSLTNNAGTYGWSSPIPSDTGSGSLFSANPDRADNATPFDVESAATLEDVFGPFGSGYKNLSYVLDGEDNGSYTLDLFLVGQMLSADDDNKTVELALLERGMDSNISVRGIRDDMTLTESVMVARGNFGSVGWSLDSRETSSPQGVGGVGISLDSSWTNIIGFRFEATAPSMNGPDLIGVGVAGDFAGIATIPAPGAGAALAIGSLFAMRRRRELPIDKTTSCSRSANRA